MSQFSSLRREYKQQRLSEQDVLENPIAQFHLWFQEAVDSNVHEPNAMILSTIGVGMRPSSRVVLLKEVEEDGFIFFTNYKSRKAREMEENPAVSLVFQWHELERQVRVEGLTEKISRHDSEVYFHSRPRESQIGAWASPQSEQIVSRDFIEKQLAYWTEQFKDEAVIPLPEHWGGFRVRPERVEFWQGRPNRLHDRLVFLRQGDSPWVLHRLAP
jgi:pyridoxamine 5'-phosphate oxidase